MKIGLQTWGTDGDFYPFLALAVGLKEAGHEVTLAYTSVDGKEYSNHPLAKGIELIKADGGIPVPKDVNPYAIAASPGSFSEYSKLLERFFDPFTEAMYSASSQLCQENDLVIGHAVCYTLLTASEKFNCPRVSLVLTPLIVRSKFVSPIGIDLGSVLNSFLWWMGGKVATASWFKTAKAIRQREGLAPIRSLQEELFSSNLLTIVAASEALVPKPKDWKSHIQMTGFLNLENSNTNWEMPQELVDFIQSGEPPVYMTFGSCMQFDAKNSTQLLIEATKLSGKRAIIQTSLTVSELEQNPNIFILDSAPHSEVFPLCSLVVHHGGAGTTQAALLAGKPSVVVAHGFDQPYWGKQLQQANVGGTVLYRKNISANRLAEEIKDVFASKALSLNALEIGAKMKAENGVIQAVDLITALVENISRA
jgi:UDP:flavonoid glycosyltransferase YjiC (YdhE family)